MGVSRELLGAPRAETRRSAATIARVMNTVLLPLLRRLRLRSQPELIKLGASRE